MPFHFRARETGARAIRIPSAAKSASVTNTNISFSEAGEIEGRLASERTFPVASY